MPGGGYGTAAKATVKTIDKIADRAKVADKVADTSKSKKLIEAEKKLENVKKGTEGKGFYADDKGNVLSKSQSEANDSFKKGGFASRNAEGREPGTIYTVPAKKGKVDVRLSEGSGTGNRGTRAVVTHPNTNSGKTLDGAATSNKNNYHFPQIQ